MSRKEHWEDIYSCKEFSEVTWFQPEPKMSLQLIGKLGLDKEAQILDIGAGASTLVDFLLEEGFKKLNLLDLSSNAFSQSQKRLEGKAKLVNWLVGDVLEYEHNQQFDLWHDRAVFHFLVNEEDQERYFQNLNKYLKPRGHLIISTFAEDGPVKCSGLEIVRYAKEELVEKLDSDFTLMDFKKETHVSPTGLEQKFNYWHFVK